MVFAGLCAQAVRPSLDAPTGPRAEIAAPPEVRAILQRRCYTCHSNEPRLAWFDQLEPAYWLVAKDVRDARSHLNFSELGNKPVAAQRAAVFEGVNMIQLGAMPLPRYLAVHRGAGVTAEELATLKGWLAPFGQSQKTELPDAPAASVPFVAESKAASLSLNGVPFFPGYRDWKLMATTDRGDNHTLRMITGNEIAAAAVTARETNPWPDGAAFAKITVAAVDDGQGHVTAGKFVQVEFMVKDKVKYAKTQGWGYARYRGDELKPYGADAHFDRECTGCHAPMRDNDYVFTTPIPHGGGQ